MPKPDYKQETMEGEMRAYVTKQQRGRSSRLFNVEDTTGPGFACELQQRMLWSQQKSTAIDRQK